MLFQEKNNNSNVGTLQLKLGNKIVEQVGTNCPEKYFKFVGHVLDDSLSWIGHVEHVCKKLASSNYAINSTKNFLPKKVRLTLYHSLFDSHLNFGNLLWSCANKKSLDKIENLQKKCLRNVALKSYKAHTEPIFKDLNILNLRDKFTYCRSIFMHQYRNNKPECAISSGCTSVYCTLGLVSRRPNLGTTAQGFFNYQMGDIHINRKGMYIQRNVQTEVRYIPTNKQKGGDIKKNKKNGTCFW